MKTQIIQLPADVAARVDFKRLSQNDVEWLVTCSGILSAEEEAAFSYSESGWTAEDDVLTIRGYSLLTMAGWMLILKR